MAFPKNLAQVVATQQAAKNALPTNFGQGWGDYGYGLVQKGEQQGLFKDAAETLKAFTYKKGEVSLNQAAPDILQSLWTGSFAGTPFKDMANQPMSFNDYYNESLKLYKGEIQTGKKVKPAEGIELFKVMSNKQRGEAMGNIAENYGNYLTSFVNNQNMNMQARQNLTDTDAALRGQNPQYTAGHGATSGWGRGNMLSSQTYTNTRRRAWGEQVTGV